MARHVLTTEEKLRGIRRGIRTLKNKRGGPKWLVPSMKRYERKLTAQLKRGNSPDVSDAA
jgi:hypothetical protein